MLNGDLVACCFEAVALLCMSTEWLYHWRRKEMPPCFLVLLRSTTSQQRSALTRQSSIYHSMRIVPLAAKFRFTQKSGPRLDQSFVAEHRCGVLCRSSSCGGGYKPPRPPSRESWAVPLNRLGLWSSAATLRARRALSSGGLCVCLGKSVFSAEMHDVTLAVIHLLSSRGADAS